MDHLPLPRNPQGPDVFVPYLCQEQYDGNGPLLEYPARVGWTVDYTQKGVNIFRTSDGEPSGLTDIAAFLQTWLYFGLLHEAVGIDYQNFNFLDLSNMSKGRRLTSENLEQLIGPWSEDLCSHESLDNLEDLEMKWCHVEQSIREVRRIVSHISPRNPEFLAPTTTLAIAVLAEYLWQALQDIRLVEPFRTHMIDRSLPFQPWRLAVKTGKFDPGKPILEAMREIGWCQSDLARLNGTVEYVGVLYYMSQLEPPRKDYDHSNCTAQTCLAAQINPLHYTLMHTHETCRCALLYADQRQLRSMLDDRCLPLVELRFDRPDQESHIHLRAAIPDEPFIALSHVWADGLGNPLDNALHLCSLQMLSKLTASLSEDGSPLPLWIDTLCVPVKPLHYRELAIRRMREPYQRAAAVLVLDPYLRAISRADVDEMEIFARILCCGWLQRLWTLQESRLARRAVFQLRETTVDLKTLFANTSFRRIPSKALRSVQLDLIFSYEASCFTDKIPDYNGDILSTRRNIKTRSVSVRSDEVLCLSCLMNIDLEPILAAPEDDRMAVFWTLQQLVPTGLVFSYASAKLQHPGLHWAPETFLGIIPGSQRSEEDLWYGSNYRSKQLTARPTPNGLLAGLPGVLLPLGLNTLADNFPSSVPTNRRLEPFGPSYLRGPNSVWYMVWREKQWTTRPDGSHQSRDRWAVILDESIRDRHRGVPGQALASFDFTQSIQGILVTVSRDENDVLYVHGHHHVILACWAEGYQQSLDVAMGAAEAVARDRKLTDWTWDPQTDDACLQRASQILQNDREKELFESWSRFDGFPRGPEFLRDLIMNFGMAGDKLLMEATDDEQQWCVD